jgi:pyruvate dehydrogenase E2 component (dihydrolipoamide acetyltransferase)
VARPGDELVTAALPEADCFGPAEFNTRLNRQMRRAWTRGDQAGAATQLLLSSLAAEGITDGIPTLVAPSIATLFVGAAYQDHGKVVAKLSLTFDHRLINGIAAARFLNGIDKEIDQLKAALIPD